MEKLTSDKETQTDKEETSKFIVHVLPNVPLNSSEQTTHALRMFVKWAQEAEDLADKDSQNKPAAL